MSASPPNPKPAAPLGSRADQRPPLQQLASLAQFATLVDRQLGQCRRLDLRAAVLLIEIEPPPARGGAALQQAIGARLSGRVRGSDLVVRVGERQFGLVLVGAGRAEGETVRARLHQALGGPYGVDAARLYVGLHMGLAVYREHGRSGRDLVQAVEAALRQGAAAPATLSVVRGGAS